MRVPVRQLTIATVLSTTLYAPAIAEDNAPPQRKAGLWEVTTVAPVSGMTKQQICVGENDDIIRPEGANCTEPEVTSLNEGKIVTIECSTEDSKQVISGTFTGDFETRYHATMKTTFEPPVGSVRNMGVKLDGKYLGPDCPEDGETDAN